MAFNSITYDTVAKCTGYPTNEEIMKIYNTLLKKSKLIEVVSAVIHASIVAKVEATTPIKKAIMPILPLIPATFHL